MSSGPQLRTLLILRCLMLGWRTLGEMSSEFDVSTKGVRRALACIRRAGFDVRHKTEAHGRRRYHVVAPRKA